MGAQFLSIFKIKWRSGLLQTVEPGRSHFCAKNPKFVPVSTSDSSSDEGIIASLQRLRSENLQSTIDKRIRDLDQSTSSEGNDLSKVKAKWGGNVEVQH